MLRSCVCFVIQGLTSRPGKMRVFSLGCYILLANQISCALKSLNSGGIVIIQDIMRMGPYTETSPKIALESLLAAVFFGGSGGVVSGDETVEFLTEAGFTAPTQMPLPGVYFLVTAVKP